MPSKQQSKIEYSSHKHGIEIKGEGKFVERIIRRDQNIRLAKDIVKLVSVLGLIQGIPRLFVFLLECLSN